VKLHGRARLDFETRSMLFDGVRGWLRSLRPLIEVLGPKELRTALGSAKLIR
jgi:hypothetical protein